MSLEVQTFGGQETVVVVMFEFGHISGDVDLVEEVGGEVAAGKTERGAFVAFFDEVG